MSPLSSLKRLSISSTKSAKSSNCSAQVNGHPSPLDITFALNIQPSVPSPISPWALTPSNDGTYAEMLEDDNMSWAPSKTSSSRSKRSRRRSFIDRLFYLA